MWTWLESSKKKKGISRRMCGSAPSPPLNTTNKLQSQTGKPGGGGGGWNMGLKYLQPISKKRKWTLISRAEAVIAALPINSAVFALIKPRHWPVQNPGVKQQTQDGPTDDAGESKNYCQLSGCEDKDALKHRRRRSCSWAAGNSVETCQRAAEILDHNTSWHSDCSAVRLLTQTDSWVWGCRRYRQQAQRYLAMPSTRGARNRSNFNSPNCISSIFPRSDSCSLTFTTSF